MGTEMGMDRLYHSRPSAAASHVRAPRAVGMERDTVPEEEGPSLQGWVRVGEGSPARWVPSCPAPSGAVALLPTRS